MPERSISLPSEPTRPESPESAYSLYVTERADKFATNARIEQIAPKMDVIQGIGEAVRTELNVRDIRVQRAAPHVGTLLLRTNQMDLKHPLAWDPRADNAPEDAKFYAYHPYRKPEATSLDAIVADVQASDVRQLRQISVEQMKDFSQNPKDSLSVRKVADSFLTGTYALKPNGSFEKQMGWEDIVGNVLAHPRTAQAVFSSVPEAVGKRWVIEQGSLPFAISKSGK